MLSEHPIRSQVEFCRKILAPFSNDGLWGWSPGKRDSQYSIAAVAVYSLMLSLWVTWRRSLGMITVQTKPFPGRPCHEYRCFLDCGLNGPVNIDHKLLHATCRGRRVDKLNKTYSMRSSDHWRKIISTVVVSEKRREACSCKFWEYEARLPRKSPRSPSRGWLWSSTLIWPRSSTRMLGIRLGSSVYLGGKNNFALTDA